VIQKQQKCPIKIENNKQTKKASRLKE